MASEDIGDNLPPANHFLADSPYPITHYDAHPMLTACRIALADDNNNFRWKR